MISTLRPVVRTIAAAPPWAASFASGGSVKRSSARPARKSSVMPARTPTSSSFRLVAPAATAASEPSVTPR
jgi:hypothetical protein